MRYSVIIPTYNRASALGDALWSLFRQDVPAESFEVIVVDDGSTDRTREVFEQFVRDSGAKNFSYLAVPHRGPAAARNAGIRAARGEILFFTDDDCIAPPYWIRTIADAYQRYPDAAGVGGWYLWPREVLRRSRTARYLLFWGLHCVWRGREPFFRELSSTDQGSTVGTTANMSYRRDVLEKVGGFDESREWPALEDWDLKLRVLAEGYPLVYVPVFVLHNKDVGILALLRDAFRDGRGGRYLNLRYGDGRYPFFFRWRNVRWYVRRLFAVGQAGFVPLYLLHAMSYSFGWLYGGVR